MRTWPLPASSRRSTSASVGPVSRDGSCAPAYRGLSHGPSRWTPASRPSSTRSARRATDGRRAGTVSVTRLATTVVVPCARCARTAVAAASWSPPSKDAPPPPCRWTSTNPGATVRRTAATSTGAGGVPLTDLGDRVPLDTQPPRREDPRRGDHTVGREEHAQALVSASTDDSSSSSSRPGVLRFHRRITKRKRK